MSAFGHSDFVHEYLLVGGNSDRQNWAVSDMAASNVSTNRMESKNWLYR